MLDAYGWEIYKKYPILSNFLSASRLESVFGYTSACLPSILSGRYPQETLNWCYFYADAEHSPFRELEPLKYLPDCVTSRRKFRILLSRVVKKKLGLEGYFDLYNIPLKSIGEWDFSEKRSPLKPGGMNQGRSIIDELRESGIRYFISDPEASEFSNFENLRSSIRGRQLDFAFCYWPGLDGLMHVVGNSHPDIKTRMTSYERWILELMDEAYKAGYKPVVHVFSDHGMANLKGTIHPDTLLEPIKKQGPVLSVVDSTMMRLYFRSNDSAQRKSTEDFLNTNPYGRVIGDAELQRLGTFFPDYKFGETIFLLDEGYQFEPSDMGTRAMKGMHGYHPSEKQSYATLLSSDPAEGTSIKSIVDIYTLMSDSLDQIELSQVAVAFSQDHHCANTSAHMAQ